MSVAGVPGVYGSWLIGMSGIYTCSILSHPSISLSFSSAAGCSRSLTTRSRLSSDGGCQGGVVPYPEESSVSTDLVSLCPSTRSTGEPGRRRKRRPRAASLGYCVARSISQSLQKNILNNAPLCARESTRIFFFMTILENFHNSASLSRGVCTGADPTTPPRQASAPSRPAPAPPRGSQKHHHHTRRSPLLAAGPRHNSRSISWFCEYCISRPISVVMYCQSTWSVRFVKWSVMPSQSGMCLSARSVL